LKDRREPIRFEDHVREEENPLISEEQRKYVQESHPNESLQELLGLTTRQFVSYKKFLMVSLVSV